MTEYRSWSTKNVSMGAFFLCFFIAGIPFWTIPYSQVTLPNSLFGVGVVAVFLVSAVLCAAFRLSFWRSLVVPGLAFPAILMVRVVVEGIMDPSRHNLWPLALIIVALMGVAVAGLGALLGWLISRIFP